MHAAIGPRSNCEASVDGLRELIYFVPRIFAKYATKTKGLCSKMIREALLVACLIVAAMGKEKAILEIMLYDTTENGVYDPYDYESYQLSGHFSPAGATVRAEGQIIQVHPLALCNNDDYQGYPDVWVGVMKLEGPQVNDCMTMYQKAKIAIQNGATAIVFDITENPDAARQLRRSAQTLLERPVIIIRGREAQRMMQIVNTSKRKQARVRIWFSAKDKLPEESQYKEYFHMGIFTAVFVLFCIICVIVIIKLNFRQRERQLSMSELAKRAIAKLETRKYKTSNMKPQRSYTPTSDIYSHSSGTDACAICLEDYQEGQELRVLPCSHEFHCACVDPWLITNRTCPLCLFNIMAYQHPSSVPQESTSVQQQSTSTATGHSSTNNNHNHQQDLTSSISIHIPQSEYYSLHCPPGTTSFIHGCPSCESTRGSTPSSFNSNFQELPPIHSGQNMYRSFSRTPSWEYSHALQRALYLAKSYASSEGHKSVPNSGIRHSQLMMFHPSSQDSASEHVYGAPVYLGRTRVYTPRLIDTIATWDSDPECNSSKNISVAATYGSSSSDRNPSDESLHCDCCRRMSDSTYIDSNQSTYGSSDIKDPSDVSSYDSNVYQSERQETATKRTPVSIPHTLHLQTACKMTKKNSRISVKRAMEYCLQYSSSETSLSSQLSAQLPQCNLCHGSSKSLSQLSAAGFSDDSFCSETSHMIAKNSCILEPQDCQGKSKNSNTVIKHLHKSQMTQNHPKRGSLKHQPHQGCDQCEKKTRTHTNERHSIPSLHGKWKCSVPHNGTVSRLRSGEEIWEHYRLSKGRPNSLVKSHKHKAISTNEVQLSQQDRVCPKCRIHPVSPRRSMVLYTEPQGTVITLPLEEQEKYDPINAV